MENLNLDVPPSDAWTVYAVPAYGRNYDCLADVLLDYLDGKDFRIVNGAYFSIRDTDELLAEGIKYLSINDWLIPVK